MKKNIIGFICRMALTLGVAVVVVELYPSMKTQFNYTYHEGKPWSHDLVTAEFDFPIYKTDDELAEDSLMALQSFTPYFTRQKDVPTKQLERLRQDRNRYTDAEYGVLEQELQQLYRDGLVDSDAEDVVRQVQQVSELDNSHNAKLVDAKQLHTLRQAYDSLLQAGQRVGLDLTSLNIQDYLQANLLYEKTLSEQERQRLLSGISQTKGMVQTDQRIIDRGEVVTPERLAMLDSMKRAYEEKEKETDTSYTSLLGEYLFAGTLLMLLLLYLYLFRPEVFNSWRDLLFLYSMLLMMVFFASVMNNHTDLSTYLVPFALLPVVVRLFFDGRTALFCHWITVLLVSAMVPSPWEFVLVEVTAGMTAVSTLRHLMQRSQLASTALWVGLVTCLIYTAIQLILGVHLTQIDPFNYAIFGVSALLILAAYGFIYLFERLFGLTSSISLVELTNVNSDFLIKFSETAPGTFQHSMQVSNLAMEAANRIGANALLVRCGAMYHDIGKMEHPERFTENQVGGQNPLLDLPLEEAAQYVIQHVSDGVSQARKQQLPQPIIDFIRMHHGTSRTKYFLNTWLNQHPGEQPDLAKFTYPGPLPQTKETGVLMMADAVEAASRSLQTYTEESLQELVGRIIDQQMADGQLRETPLSFRDVEIVKRCFVEKLKNIYHHRIAYPELK